MKVIQKMDLQYQGGGSDKVYHAAIMEDGTMYRVLFKYGRRGSPSAGGEKTVTPDFAAAANCYNKLISEKKGKGYWEAPGISGDIWGGIAQSSSSTSSPTPPPVIPKITMPSPETTPMLLNRIYEDVLEEMLDSPAYFMQDKMNGRHLLITYNHETKVIAGFNKQGKPGASIPHEVEKAIKAVGFSIELDGECIGTTYHVFALLAARDVDFRARTLMYAYKTLETTLADKWGKNLKLVQAYFTPAEKRARFEWLKANKKEGAVFKRCNAKTTPGRPNSGGDGLKFKFTEDASVFVMAQNSGKRSIQVGVFRDDGNRKPLDDFEVFMGNVTIPPNFEVPPVGSVVDVNYLYVLQDGGSLYQPVYLGPRDDVDKSECLHSQLKIIAAPVDVDNDDE